MERRIPGFNSPFTKNVTCGIFAFELAATALKWGRQGVLGIGCRQGKLGKAISRFEIEVGVSLSVFGVSANRSIAFIPSYCSTMRLRANDTRDINLGKEGRINTHR